MSQSLTLIGLRLVRLSPLNVCKPTVRQQRTSLRYLTRLPQRQQQQQQQRRVGVVDFDRRFSTMSSNEDDSRKRKAEDGSGKKKVSQKIEGFKHTRGENKPEKEVHLGSYASPDQRKLFNVELPPEEDEAIAKTRVKRKVAFLLGYLGTRYTGFQINEGQQTLQGEFELALLRCNLLRRSNFGYPFKYGWSTSGRTDKGVHASAQVGSAKIELLPDQTLNQVRDELNKVLPEDFRVLDVKRTTRNFCAHTQRDRVRYQYMIPSFMFCDTAKMRSIFEQVGATKNDRNLGDPLSAEEVAQASVQLKSYRITESQLDLLRKALKSYDGTHSFHNFTRGVKSSEARAARFIEYFRVEDPVVFDDGTEWIPTQVLGQSFLIHQIRKMVCMAIDVARGAAPLETLTRALSKSSDIRISPAPAQGLYLDMSFYTGYNKRSKQSNPDLPDLDWTQEDSEEFKMWKEFRNGIVMKHVVEEEAREGNFIKHLFVCEFGFDYHGYYQLEGERQFPKGDKMAEINS